MIRRLPILATLVVLVCVGIMIALGIWQLHRAAWKEDLLSRFHAAQAMSADVPWPAKGADTENVLYRHATANCAEVLAHGAISGRNVSGEAGWAQIARCRIPGASDADVVLGWSRQPEELDWQGGQVSGVIGPGRGGEIRLVASSPVGGLQPNALPDPKDIPNNHMSYAVQWFFFAATALAIYALALRKRLTNG